MFVYDVSLTVLCGWQDIKIQLLTNYYYPCGAELKQLRKVLNFLKEINISGKFKYEITVGYVYVLLIF